LFEAYHGEIGLEADEEGFDLVVPGVVLVEVFEECGSFAVGSGRFGELSGFEEVVSFVFVGYGACDEVDGLDWWEG
jgi:hypothetical protein